MTNQYQTAQLKELDALHHLHPFTNHRSLRAGSARVMVRGDGPYIWDSEGKRVLDGMSGLWTANVGHSRQELAEAAYEQMLKLPFYNTFFRTTHPQSSFLWLVRFGIERHRDPSNPSLLGAQGRAQATHHHFAQERLSRVDDCRRFDGRHGPRACAQLPRL